MGFDSEREALRKSQSKVKEKETDSKKLTGKELFMIDKSLIDSDLKFDEGERNIIISNIAQCQVNGFGSLIFAEEDTGPIDESLFEDLEDLDIEDSEED